jgi:DNA-binding NarL/FixJ family response regulator
MKNSDDDIMLSEALKDYLTKDMPHEIVCFNTGEACLKSLNEIPDVIILDYYLNTVQTDAANGMEILKELRTNYPMINIIMLSSQEHYAVALQTIQKGAVQYVLKDEEAFGKIAEIIKSI